MNSFFNSFIHSFRQIRVTGQLENIPRKDNSIVNDTFTEVGGL